MAALVVGDIHGKIEIVKELLQDPNQAVIFVGDFVDSFDRTLTEQIECLDMVLDAIESRSNVLSCIGNHELSYIDNRFVCSGYNHWMQTEINNRRERILKNLQIILNVNGFLISHAGLSKTWLEDDPKTMEDLVTIVDEMPTERLFQIGLSRGGNAECGGVLWCDESEFIPLTHFSQVFGHSRSHEWKPDEVYDLGGNNWNVDCLDVHKQVLEIQDGIAKVIKL